MKKLGLLLVVLVLGVCMMCIGGCTEGTSSQSSLRATKEAEIDRIIEDAMAEIDRQMEKDIQELLRPEVTYKVSGKNTLKASLTLETPDGTSQQEARLPWQKSYDFTQGSFVYLSAQNQSDSGCITVQIILRGKTWKEVESCGAYVIASASGIID